MQVVDAEKREDCLHEGDIEFGNHIELLNAKYQIHQILCADCDAVGTQIEEQSADDPESYHSIGEMWHKPSDYYRSDLAETMQIRLSYK